MVKEYYSGKTYNYVEEELLYNKFTEPSVRKSLEHLKEKLPEQPRILDLGCGPGGHLHLFDQVFPEAEVVACDISEPHLEHAEKISEDLSIDTEFVKKDLSQDTPSESGPYDLIWAADLICPCYLDQPEMVVNEVKELLTDNGVLAVFYGNWLRQMLMPGYAKLEQKINVAYELIHEDMKGRPWEGPDHPEKALKWLIDADFKTEQKVFCSTHVKNEMDKECLDYVKHVFNNDYSDSVKEKGPEAGITERETRKLEQLFDPESILYLPEKEDYYCNINCILTYGSK